MENKYYVYQIRRADCVEPLYVGKGCGDRYLHHLKDATINENTLKSFLIRVAKSEGIDVLSEILSENMSELEAYEQERCLIAQYKLISEGGNLANQTRDGEKIRSMTPEWRKKIGDAHRGRVKSREVVERQAAKLRGHKMPAHVLEMHKNRVVSDETRQKMREARLGAKDSKETCEKKRAARLRNVATSKGLL